MEKLDEAIQDGYLHLERITPERFEQAKQLRLKFQDKPRISFTDLTSMVVMEELGITDILMISDNYSSRWGWVLSLFLEDTYVS